MTSQPIMDMWNWIKANDLPNWVVVLFTAILWPLVLFIWHRRSVSNVPGLEVRLSPGNIQINGEQHNAVAIDVINHTGAVVYVTATRIKSCSALFTVPPAVSRDIAEGSYFLAFIGPNAQFDQREITLQTNETARTAIGVSAPLNQSFYTYRAPWYRRLINFKKYFVLEYVAMVGQKRSLVRTVY